ncbi:MAG: AI-2E family transporter [Gemmatimonadota bacterium]|nr:AI-2E family transporter [Gemmatimonadota bacterium]
MSDRLTTETEAAPGDRRRVERRTSQLLAELTLPELRRMVLTMTLSVVVLVLFLWMVRTVIIGAILAVIVALYIRPLYERVLRVVPSRTPASLLTLFALMIPLIAISIYSWIELRHATQYLTAHQDEVVAQIDGAIHRIPFAKGETFTEQIRNGVLAATGYGTKFAMTLKAELAELTVAVAIFFFTLWYVLVDGDEIVAYVRSKVPSRYAELAAALESNVRGVLYGAIYGTVVTQTIKSIVILILNLVFQVPLAVVLAILSFIIGFFPIVGSWSVYLPVALWLVIFRNAWISAAIILLVGFFGNTMFISMYVRPKLAAEKSRVLNFYWMFVALVTGVYTFGIVGILLGPIIIGLLKAVIDTVTAQQNWRLFDADGEPVGAGTGALVIPSLLSSHSESRPAEPPKGES